MTEQKPFLVPYTDGNVWVDINTGIEYMETKRIKWEDAEHGLCEKYGKPVLKNLGYPKKVFIATKKPKSFQYDRSKYASFMDADKHKKYWEFIPYELETIIKCMDKGLSERQISMVVGAPKDAVTNILYKIRGDIKKHERIRSSKVSGRRTNKESRDKRKGTRDKDGRGRKDSCSNSSFRGENIS